MEFTELLNSIGDVELNEIQETNENDTDSGSDTLKIPDSKPERNISSAQRNIETFTKRLLNLEHEKKVLQEDIKALKDEFKDEGVPVQVVTRVINQIKREKRQSEGELHEEIVIKEWLESSTEIDDEIGSLVAKA